MKVYNAESQILGRFSTTIVKDLLKGENVHVVNCEKICISGNPKKTKEGYLEKRQRGDPHFGPFYPRTPKGIVRRAIRGMLPWKRKRGRDAFKRLKVWVGMPEEFKDQELIQLKESDVNKLKCKHITIEELCLWLGTEKRW